MEYSVIESVDVEIIKIELVHKFARRHPLSRVPLNRWVQIVSKSRWNSLSEVKDTDPAGDYVKGFVVFDIRGNEYRLITVIQYMTQQIIIRHVFTHPEYDRWQP